jgi:hypothetical protein
MVKPGNYGERIDRDSVLRTIEDFRGLRHLGRTQAASPIADPWRSPQLRTIDKLLQTKS